MSVSPGGSLCHEVETLEYSLLPDLNLKVQQVIADHGQLVVDAAACGPPGKCPQCGHPATRIHSRYWRHLSGLPVGERRVGGRLHVPARQPSMTSGRYCSILSLCFTARVIWPRSAAARLPMSRLTSDQVPSCGFMSPEGEPACVPVGPGRAPRGRALTARRARTSGAASRGSPHRRIVPSALVGLSGRRTSSRRSTRCTRRPWTRHAGNCSRRCSS